MGRGRSRRGRRRPPTSARRSSTCSAYAPQEWLTIPSCGHDHVHPDDLERVLDAVGPLRPTDARRSPRSTGCARRTGACVWVRDEAIPVGPGAHGHADLPGCHVRHHGAHDGRGEAGGGRDQRSARSLEHLPVVTYQSASMQTGLGAIGRSRRGSSRSSVSRSTDWLADDDVWNNLIHPADRERGARRVAAAQDRGPAVRRSIPACSTGRARRLGPRRRRDDRARRRPHASAGRLRRHHATQGWPRTRSARPRTGSARSSSSCRRSPTSRTPTTGLETCTSARRSSTSSATPPRSGSPSPSSGRSACTPTTAIGSLASRTRATPEIDWSVDYRSITRDGRVIWVHNEAVLIRDPDGTPSLLAGRRLRHHGAQGRRGAAPGGRGALPVPRRAAPGRRLHGRRRRGRAPALYISPQYERADRLQPGAARSRDPDCGCTMLHPDDRDRVLEESDRTNASGEPFDTEYRHHRGRRTRGLAPRPRGAGPRRRRQARAGRVCCWTSPSARLRGASAIARRDADA